RVKEQPLLEYTENCLKANPQKKKKGQAQFYGFKFFRFRGEEALERLKQIDGDEAPRVSDPQGILKERPAIK
ncbi:MAG: hypothetical protein N2246_03520, partial [Candidatus Sumerlaeia bacterium]|nr:hypothetical protein [Candidatus Sumerlaeia bacterium]